MSVTCCAFFTCNHLWNYFFKCPIYFWHFFAVSLPKCPYSWDEFFFGRWLNFSSDKLFQIMPKIFNWVQVCRFWGRCPPVNAQCFGSLSWTKQWPSGYTSSMNIKSDDLKLIQTREHSSSPQKCTSPPKHGPWVSVSALVCSEVCNLSCNCTSVCEFQFALLFHQYIWCHQKSFPCFPVQTSASSPYSHHESSGSSLSLSMSNRDLSSNVVHLTLTLQLSMLSESWPAPSQWLLHFGSPCFTACLCSPSLTLSVLLVFPM